MKSSFWRVGLLGLLMAGVLSISATAASPSLSERWWNWQGQSEDSQNPITDDNGADCARGQKGADWLLAGTFGTVVVRRCVVPKGKRLAGPLLNIMCDRSSSCEMTPAKESKVSLDGKSVAVFEERVLKFRLSTVAGNPVCDACSNLVKAQGYWFRTAPLSAGRHVLTIKGIDVSGFSVLATYEIDAR
jgi:hypothetical protein